MTNRALCKRVLLLSDRFQTKAAANDADLARVNLFVHWAEQNGPEFNGPVSVRHVDWFQQSCWFNVPQHLKRLLFDDCQSFQ